MPKTRKQKRRIPPEVWVCVAGCYAIGGWIGAIPGHDQTSVETATEYAQAGIVAFFFGMGLWKIVARAYWTSGWTRKPDATASNTLSQADGAPSQTTSSEDGASQ